ncbi:MAG: DNA mismatch repair protein MutL [Thermotogales bacterium 46_20]|nr:MAG: DNA mismatch repair protein MutL [Thermotogales bacterium 46_20]
MRIHELPVDIVNKIAAGEVVTGCYSVVKELIENAMDAGAEDIEVEIRQGGKEYIRVRDNGSGMLPDEMLVALRPHTTSKIKSLEDLESLHTFGFRGEALSTIASVSRVRMVSRVPENDLGHQVESSGGSLTSQSNVQCSPGTSIEVFDLLFNTPARRKFLKSSTVEARMVTETLQRFMLGSPAISFLFRRDGEPVYNVVKTEEPLERILSVYPDLERDDLIPVDLSEKNVRVSGFVTLPEKFRGNRLRENLFINGRYVRMPILNFAVERGYGESLMKGRFPSTVLFIHVDTSEIDVNVHPQKLEVKFSQNQPVLNALQRAVREALRGRQSFRITIDKDRASQTDEENKAENEPPARRQGPLKLNESTTTRGYGTAKPLRASDFRSISTDRLNRFDREMAIPESISDLTLVGMLNERYVIARTDDSLMIIDQHAAHERILFDQLKTSKHFPSQYLTSEIEIRLDELEVETFAQKGERLEDFGFQVILRNSSLFVKGVPQMIDVTQVSTLVHEIIEELRLEVLEGPEKVFDNILSSMACRRAVKTGDKLSEEELRELLVRMSNIEMPVCPHGRPLIMKIGLKDLDRFFDR